MSSDNTSLGSMQDDGSDNNDLQNQLALAAVVIAVVAFVVAMLQVLLQYLTSNQRDKCLTGAIGGWSRFTKTRWDFATWRIRVKYPKLNLSPYDLVQVRQTQERELLDWIDDHDLHYLRTTYGYFKVRKLDIRHGSSVMFSEADLYNGLHFWNLSTKHKLSWIWFKIRKHRRCPGFARAGWANVLTALHVCPDDSLLDGHDDADVIPSAVDVPFQVIDLHTLGLLCYMFGLRDVKIDEQTGAVNAQNALMRVQTMTIPGVGQVVGIDGDFENLRKIVHMANSDELRALLRSANGYINISLFQPSIHFLEETGGLYGLLHRWNNDIWDAYRRHLTNKYLIEEADHVSMRKVSPSTQCADYQIKMKTSVESWDEIWTEMIGSATPTIIKYLAFLPFMPIWCAQPVDLYFSAYTPHIEESRAKFMAQLGVDGIPTIQRHPIIESNLAFNKVPFIRPSSEFLLSRDAGAPPDGARTWILEPNIPVLRTWYDAAEVVDQTLDHTTPLVLPNSVIDLLNGKSMPDVRTQLADYTFEAGISGYTLESTIYLSLMLLDSRIQNLWCTVEGSDYGPVSGFYTVTELTPEEQIRIINESRFHPSASLIDFLAVWLEICSRKDALGKTSDLQAAFKEILHDWSTQPDTMCISLLDDYQPELSPEYSVSQEFMYAVDRIHDPRLKAIIRNLADVTTQGESKTRAEFVEWVKEEDGKRVEIISKMLPLMQLRVYLMHLSIQCYADSSLVCKAGRTRGVEVRLI
ncbi:hypothetical protein ABW19_dt0210291 [Dactylella cylindrospora]|nr:hypothetical protein ABW19_dt0210291 [Dactylella cylindrospora]